MVDKGFYTVFRADVTLPEILHKHRTRADSSCKYTKSNPKTKLIEIKPTLYSFLPACVTRANGKCQINLEV